MRAADRIEEEKQYIQSNGRVIVSEISKIWKITEETARRDLDKLEGLGLITRTHGGAVWNKDLGAGNIRFFERQQQNLDLKHSIAVKALPVLRQQTTILADASTTVVEAICMLSGGDHQTVVTNSTEVLQRINNKNLNLISTGGSFNSESLSLQGQLAKKTIDLFNVNLAVISCKGLDYRKGVFDSYESEAEIKKAMIQKAQKVALLADHTKFNHIAFLKLVDFDHIDYIITDLKPSDDWIQFCRERDIELIY